MPKKVTSPPKPKGKSVGQRYGQGRPTLEDLEQRKARVLEVATALFLAKGYAETSLVEIAKQAGVATRTIYQHFGDKEQIFQVVLDQRAAEPEREPPRINAEQKLFEALTSTAHYVCAIAFSGAAIPFQRLMIAESQRFPEVMRRMFDVMVKRLHLNVKAVFEQLAEAGKIPPGNHSESTKFFIDLLLGTAPLNLSMNWIPSGPSEKEICDKVALFITGRFGIKPDSGGNNIIVQPEMAHGETTL